MVDNNGEGWNFWGQQRWRTAPRFFSLSVWNFIFHSFPHFTAYMLACKIHHHNHPNKRTSQMEKKSSKKEFHNLCIILGFFLFFSFDDDEDDGQPRTTATPHSRSFWNNGWCLFVYIYFSSLPWDLVFFFLCYNAICHLSTSTRD